MRMLSVEEEKLGQWTQFEQFAARRPRQGSFQDILPWLACLGMSLKVRCCHLRTGEDMMIAVACCSSPLMQMSYPPCPYLDSLNQAGQFKVSAAESC